MTMKRRLASVLAIVMMLCMALPQTALAATTYYIDVSISGPSTVNPGTNPTVTAHSSYYGTQGDNLLGTMVTVINDSKAAIKAEFNDDGLRAFYNNAMSAYETGGDTWSQFVENNAKNPTDGFVAILQNKDATVGALTLNTPYSVSYEVGSDMYTVIVTAKIYTTGGGGGGSSSGGSTTTDPTTPQNPGTSTVTKPDGSTVTTEVSKPTTDASGTTSQTIQQIITDKDGNTTSIETVNATNANGTTATTVTTVDAQGNTQITAEVNVSAKDAAAANNNGAVTVPVTVDVAQKSENVPVVTVNLPAGSGKIKVEVPTSSNSAGQVAVIVDENGNETIVPKSTITENGVIMEMEGSANIKIIDNSKNFNDVPDTHWASSAVDFLSSREIINGTSADTFSPNMSTSRGMVVTMLHRFESNPNADISADFGDVDNDAYYADAVNWAAKNGIVSGYEDGSFRPDADMSRQELVTTLYRYAGEPKQDGSADLNFNDADQVQAYASDAMQWAVGNHIVNGKGNGVLDPNGKATRAEFAQIMQNYCNYALAG